MQSKINNFFKSPSDPTPPAAVSAIASSDDDLANWNWENNHHTIINTYTRTRRNPNPTPSPPTVIQKPAVVVKNKKRSYAQFHLELGQSDFLLRSCSTCGIEFTPGDVDDEKLHNQFHKRYTQGIQFRGWNNERVISSEKTGRVILVLENDPSSHRNKVQEVVKMMEIEMGTGWIAHQHCKRIVGCVIAEPIKEAFRVASCSDDGHSASARKREKKLRPTTLQFGNIVFQREVGKRVVNLSDSEVMDGGAISCESKPVTAVCGIRAIWVTPSNRRKHIASQLLDTVRSWMVLLYASKYNDVKAVVNISGRYDLKAGIEERIGKDYMERLKEDGFIDVKRPGSSDYRVTLESLLDRLDTNMHEACLQIDTECRVLTVHGSSDTVISVEDAYQFAQILPNHTLHVIAGADHSYTNHQNELASFVVDFIK